MPARQGRASRFELAHAVLETRQVEVPVVPISRAEFKRITSQTATD